MVSPRAIEYSQRFVAFGAEVPPNATPEIMRRHTARLYGSFGLSTNPTEEQISANGVDALWLTPADAVPNRVVMYIHGGGYMTGSPKTHANGAGQLAQRLHARALLPDYRLSPEDTFPTQIQDCLNVFQWLLHSGYKPENIVFAGESAGGALCITTQLLALQRKLPTPAASYTMSPWLDLDCVGESYKTNLQNDVAATPESAKATAAAYKGSDGIPSDPLYNVLEADLTGLSPLFAQAGGDEILLSDSVTLVKQAQKYGVSAELDIVPHMQHMFQLDAGKMPEADAAMDRGAAFLRGHLQAAI